MSDIPSKPNASISTKTNPVSSSMDVGNRNANCPPPFGLSIMKRNVHATQAADMESGNDNDNDDRFDGGGLLIARTRSLDETTNTKTPLRLPYQHNTKQNRHLRQKQRFPHHHSAEYDHCFMLEDDLCCDEDTTASTALHSSFDASLLRGEQSFVKEEDGNNTNIGDEMVLEQEIEYDLSGRKINYLMRPRNVMEDSISHNSNNSSITNNNFGVATVPDNVQKIHGTKATRRVTNEVPYLPKTPGRPTILRNHHGATIENVKPVFNSPPPSSAVKRRRAASLQKPRPSPMRRVVHPSRTSLAPTAGTPLTASSSMNFPAAQHFGNHLNHQNSTQNLLMTPLVSQTKIAPSNSSPSYFHHPYNTSTIPSPFSSHHHPAMTPTCHANTTSNSCETVGNIFCGGVKKMPYYTGTTAGTTPLETTFETDTVETSSPEQRFRFTSFPASLPRINNPRTPRERLCPDSVRKRMSFGTETERKKGMDETYHGDTPAGHDGTGVNQSCDVNHSRDDEGTHNTSISSLSAEGGHHQHLPEAPSATSHLATRTIMKRGTFLVPNNINESTDLYGEEHGHFGYSDDDDDDDVVGDGNGDDHDGDIDDGDKKRGRAGRTRLDFNVFVSPPHKPSGPNIYTSNLGDSLLKPLDLNLELSRPYDQRRINSFPSSLSSTTQMNTSSCDDEIGTSMSPSRLGDKCSHPSTPREVQLRFPLESECSPIQDVKDDPIHIVVEGNQDSSSASSSSLLVGDKIMPPMSSVSESGLSTCHPLTIGRKEEGSTASESTNTRQRRLRPMPDMSAFESGTAASRVDRSADGSAAYESRVVLPMANRLLCPPTPQRTPAWVNEGGHHAFFNHRQNSLITTKVLLSCPSQVLEGRSSLENSILDDDSKAARDASTGSQNLSMIARLQPEPTTMELEETNNLVDAETAPVADKVGATPNHISAPPRLTRRLPSGQNCEDIISFADDFQVLGILGSGTFADVYKVRFIGDGRMYAVKRNRRQFRGKRDRNMALAEVQSMQQLQKVCAETHGRNTHDMTSERSSYSLYVLFFYRAWQEEGYFYSQTELCCRDTCREMLDSIRFLWSTTRTRYPSLSRNLLQVDPAGPGSVEGVNGTDRLVPNFTIWKICHDILAGLTHIHSHNIVHGDLKPSNIFFVSHARFGAMCKIGDFGMAGSIGSVGDGQEGDARYMSSELLESATRRASCDIFSLGLTLYEIGTDEHIEMPSEGPRWHLLRSANQPHLPPCRSDELQKLVQAMTNPNETIRPTADKILKHRNVKEAGLGVDKFLKEYIRDVEEFDRREEERLALDQTEDQTPRNGHRSAIRRSPPLSMLLAPVPNLFSPTVVNP